MFKAFWEENRELIEFLGIVIAIGALFLSIQAPQDNQGAVYALQNIQLIWLAIITISIIILFLKFVSLVHRLEDRMGKRFQTSIESILSLPLWYTIYWLLINLWRYTHSLYGDSLGRYSDFMLTYGSIIFLMTASVISILARKLITSLVKNKILRIFLLILSMIIIGGGLVGVYFRARIASLSQSELLLSLALLMSLVWFVSWSIRQEQKDQNNL